MDLLVCLWPASAYACVLFNTRQRMLKDWLWLLLNFCDENRENNNASSSSSSPNLRCTIFFFGSKTIHAKFDVISLLQSWLWILSQLQHPTFLFCGGLQCRDVELYIDGWWIKLNTGTHFDALHIKHRGGRESNWRTGWVVLSFS